MMKGKSIEILPDMFEIVSSSAELNQSHEAPLAQEGRNCWRIVDADQLAVLIDANAYFETLSSALEMAQHSIYILGWDIDSRVKLRRNHRQSPQSDQHELRPFLNRLVKERPELEVYLLAWDYALIYALEREWAPLLNLGLRTHKRIHFHLDDQHPFGAAHHQKIVVIDDALAFSGGIDLTCHRWDTPSHQENNPLRVDAGGNRYGPFHDIQLAVSGAAARALGELARERWYRATGKRLEPKLPSRSLWPPNLEANMSQVEVAIARTAAPYKKYQAAREVEQLYLDSIAAAQHSIYIENQFLTATKISEALSARLREEQGPEVIIVAPRHHDGFLESRTMDVLRARVADKLRQSDAHGRLRLCCPALSDGKAIFVHAKVMIVDDELLRIGSANLSNRSMGLDSECDLLVEARGQAERHRAIHAVRSTLLAEHLGSTRKIFDDVLQQTGSLVKTIDALNGTGAHVLTPLEVQIPDWLDRTIPPTPPFDPPEPLRSDKLFEELVPRDITRSTRRPLLKGMLILLFLLGLMAAWRWTPLIDWLDPRKVVTWISTMRQSWAAPLVAVGVFLVSQLFFFPLTLMIVHTAFVFDALPGFIYNLSGSLLSAALSYWIGKHIGKKLLRRFKTQRVSRISRGIARGGVLGIMAVRLLPVAPYTMVNLVAGASHLPLGEFLIGTLLGLLPGIVALTFFGVRLESAVKNPSAQNLTWLAVTAVILLLVAVLINRCVHRFQAKKEAIAAERQAKRRKEDDRHYSSPNYQNRGG